MVYSDVYDVQSFCKYYAEELRLNAQFRQFIINASLLYGGYNTVAAQLQINSRWARNKGLNQSLKYQVIYNTNL